MHRILKNFKLLQIFSPKSDLRIKAIPFITQVQNRNLASSSGYEDNDNDSSEIDGPLSRSRSYGHDGNNDINTNHRESIERNQEDTWFRGKPYSRYGQESDGFKRPRHYSNFRGDEEFGYGKNSFQRRRRNEDGDFGSRRMNENNFGSRRMNEDDFGSRRMNEDDFGSRRMNEDDFGSRRMNDDDDFGSRLKKHDWDVANLDAFEKNFHVAHPSVSTRSQEDIDAFYQKHDISVSKGEKPIPIRDFQEANFPEHINSCVKAAEWAEPTPIQSIGWPLALSGKNVVGIAQTGSGKTLGFILPALVHIKHQRPVERGGEPIVLVLAPTRELAQQIQRVAHQFCRPMGIRSTCVFGGQSRVQQVRNLMKGQDLVVATPGRLIDFLQDEVINLGRTTYVVLDEADRMLDMGFEPQIRKILSQIRPDRQILMWTATWPNEIQSLAHDFLGEFTQVNIGATELNVNPNIEQTFKVCDEWEKMDSLLREFDVSAQTSNDSKTEKTLIFANTQRKAEAIARKLNYHRIFAYPIHGRKSQSYRDQTLHNFRKGHLQVLVATDVAARGLDVDDIKKVINFDLPTSIDDYIHRIGRTARASKTGHAVSFCTADDSSIVPNLVSMLKKSGQEIDPELQELASLQSKYSKKGSRKPGSRYPYKRDHQSHNRYSRRGDDWSRGKNHYF